MSVKLSNVRGIAAELNRRSIPTARGRQWQARQVANIWEGIVNLFVEKKIIDELKRGKGVESNERLGILGC